ncbi:MAG: hypothetical protein EPO10_04745 [Reyranella sp.]|uniref:hypothetical protein n=1 Tax=Reyranella sp. TaxID=1929291 RepID=UPI001227B20E|nr:MAG: hypothetical protein EPO41_19030 [Reyranella sp.]TBR30072.1 MAG: hypothetical protein EPO10_04745 [Reyranella sp.]
MRRSEIERQNQYLIRQQREFRMAADVVADAFAAFPEVQAVAVIGSVAKRLWKEVPRFSEYRRARIEVWHECSDLDLAVWLHSQDRLEEMRRALARSLTTAFEAGTGISTPSNRVDVFLFEPGSDRYLGRLCRYSTCPKGKLDCLVPGCGTIPFNKVIDGFRPYADIVASAADTMLYERGRGRLRSALDLPSVDD